MNYSLYSIIYNFFFSPKLTLLFELQGELNEEMRRLKLELKQTMDMYNTACKETTVAKERVNKKICFSFLLFFPSLSNHVTAILLYSTYAWKEKRLIK